MPRRECLARIQRTIRHQAWWSMALNTRLDTPWTLLAIRWPVQGGCAELAVRFVWSWP
jgi:hypothetical protein